MTYGFDCKLGDPNYEQPPEKDWRKEPIFQPREGVEYEYDRWWEQLDARVNSRRFNDGLEPLTREESDALCRAIKNFEIDWKSPPSVNETLTTDPKVVVAETEEEVAKQIYGVLEDLRVVSFEEFELRCVAHPEFSDIDFTLKPPKIDKQGDQIPKWKRNLPPKVQQNLKRKGRRR